MAAAGRVAAGTATVVAAAEAAEAPMEAMIQEVAQGEVVRVVQVVVAVRVATDAKAGSADAAMGVAAREMVATVRV